MLIAITSLLSIVGSGTDEPSRLEGINAWISNFLMQKLPDCLVMFNVWSLSDVALLKAAFDGRFSFSTTVPIQASMYLFSKWSYDSGILIFSQTEYNFEHRPFLWGPEQDSYYSRSLVILTCDSHKLAVFQSTRRFSDAQTPSIAECSARIIADFEVASMVTDLQLGNNAILIANLPGNALQEGSSCLASKRISELLQWNTFDVGDGDSTIFCPIDGYQIHNAAQPSYAIISKDPKAIDLSSMGRGISPLGIPGLDAIGPRMHEIQSHGVMLVLSIIGLYWFFSFLEKTSLVKKICQYFSSPPKNSPLHTLQEKIYSSRILEFLIRVLLSLMNVKNQICRKWMRRLHILLFEYSCLDRIKSVAKVQGGGVDDGFSLATLISNSNLFSFKHTSLQYITYPLFVLIHIVGILAQKADVKNIPLLFQYFYTILSSYWCAWLILGGGNYRFMTCNPFSYVTLGVYFLALLVTIDINGRVIAKSMFTNFLLSMALVFYLINAILVHGTFLRWHHYHLLLLFSIIHELCRWKGLQKAGTMRT